MANNNLLSKITINRLLLACIMVVAGLAACQEKSNEAPTPSFVNTTVSSSELPPPSLPSLDNSLHFDHVTPEDGLSQSTINSIVQDDQGFMWFATNSGLNRYDGYEITVFRHDPSDPESIADNIVQSLFVDSAGTMWIGTEGSGLDVYDRDRELFIHHAHDPNDPSSISSDFIYSIYEDRSGMIWVGTLSGLNKFDPISGTFTHYQSDLDSADDSVGTNFIIAIHEDSFGKLWLGTASGLITFDPAAELFATDPLPPRYTGNPVISLYEDRQGNLWIGTFNDGVYQYNPENDEVTLHRRSPVKLDSISNNIVRAIAEDLGGNIWLATDGGLNRLAPGGTGFIHEQYDPTRPNSPSDDITPSLFVDQSGIVWSGTFTGGVNKFDPYKSKFMHVKSDPDIGLSSDLVVSFLEDSEGNFWVGTFEGLNRIDAASGEIERYRSGGGDPYAIANDVIMDLLEDQFGDIWIATQGGLSRYVRESNDFVSYRFDPNDPLGLSFPVIQDLFEDSAGDLWIGTAGGGFDKFDHENETFTHYQFDEVERIEGIGPDNIHRLLEDDSGQFWLGTLAGLAKFDRDSGEIFYYAHDPSDPDSLSDDYVLSLLEDSSGNLWVGTRNGLNRFVPEDETFVRFLLEDGIPDGVVYGILEDDDGNLWISTNRGISRFSPATGTFHNFDTGDGLQALEFNVNAYYRSDAGEMFFGGVNGFNHFYPDDITNNPYIPPIIVSNIQIQNQEVEHGEESRIEKPISQLDSIELDRGDNSISFELASLHFSEPEDNQFAYFMEGFDEEWNYIGNRRYATYTNLPPGDYTFRAIGTNSDGEWNLDGTSIEVSMPFPFWRTWWFLLLVALSLAATVYGAFRLRIRSSEARTRELEQQVVTRTSEVEKRREIAEGLREILVILNSSRSLEESLHYIVDQAAGLTDAEDAIIFRQQQPDQMAIVATNQGGQIRYTPGAALLAISTNWINDGLLHLQPLIMPDLGAYWEEHPDIQPTALAVHKALLGVPLHLGEEVYGGVLMFYRAKRTFSPDDLELGSTFADQAALAVANDRLRAQAEETAVATERNRLARDLHDAVTQTLFSASLIAETLPLIYDNDEAEGRHLLQELRQLTRGALAEMRTLLLELRPMALEESELPDLLLQLSEAVTGRTGIPIDTSIERPCNLPTPVRIALYRIAQEALNNVMKHARAKKVDLILSGCSDSEMVALSILDNGRGYDMDQVPSDRMGLKIISERAAAIGADLEVISQHGQGTRVVVHWRGSSDTGQNLGEA